MYPFTGSSLTSNIQAGLSTQILVEVDNQRVGAIQNFAPTQRRGIKGIAEVGTDGFIEKVPTSPTDVKISVERVVFDLLRLPQAFARAFYNIHSQRVPFNIRVYDVSAVGTAFQDADGGLPLDSDAKGILVQEYVDCWFSNLGARYQAENYLISETAEIEVTHIRTVFDPGTSAAAFRTVTPYGSSDKYERVADQQRVGSLDAVGLSQVLDVNLSQ